MVNKCGVVIAVTVAVVLYSYKYDAITTDKFRNRIPVVETSYGKLTGISGQSRVGRHYFGYLGISYAKPPVDQLRYEAPQNPDKWIGVRNATKYGSECAQLSFVPTENFTGSEDCLFLNVFTPDVETKDGKLRPCLVFIHGGAFMLGSSNIYKPDYFMDEDVVLVTLNYRLAAFGFLNTGENGVVRGNMGLKDQVLALKFVQENIAQFGGDPNQVTIFGESAGAASVHHLLMSPTTKGLFHRAISQSGIALNSWSWTYKPANPLIQARRYAIAVNCSLDDVKEMVDCLKGRGTDQLVQVHYEIMNILKDPITMFAPTIELIQDEQSFLTEHPAEILRQGRALRIPLITGYNAEEGLVGSAYLVGNEEVRKNLNDEYSEAMPAFMQFDKSLGDARVHEILSQARDFYFGVGERIDSIEKIQNFTNIVTDYTWQHQLQDYVLKQSEFSPVFAYYFSYIRNGSTAGIVSANTDKTQQGPSHGDELALFFPMGETYIDSKHEDYQISKDLVKLWACFAYDEYPLKFKDQEWEQMEKYGKSVKYLQIDKTGRMIDQPNPDRVDFWKQRLSIKGD